MKNPEDRIVRQKYDEKSESASWNSGKRPKQSGKDKQPKVDKDKSDDAAV